MVGHCLKRSYVVVLPYGELIVIKYYYGLPFFHTTVDLALHVPQFPLGIIQVCTLPTQFILFRCSAEMIVNNSEPSLATEMTS